MFFCNLDALCTHLDFTLLFYWINTNKTFEAVGNRLDHVKLSLTLDLLKDLRVAS